MINKSKKEDNMIREKLKSGDASSEIFKEAYEKLGLTKEYNKVKKIKQQIKIAKETLKYAACIILISIISFSTYSLIKNQNCTAEGEKPVEIKESADLPVATMLIDELGDSEKNSFFMSPVGKKELVESADYIAIVKLKKIKKYFNYISKLNVYSNVPLTLSEYEIVNNLKGDLNGDVDIITFGGVISLLDYEKACPISMDKKLGLEYMSEEEKAKTYVKVSNDKTKTIPELEKDKHYLVYFRYNEGMGAYKMIESTFYEYNMENSTILNTDTLEWEKFEFIDN